MTQLLTYPDIDPQQWQELVDSSPYATWFQTKEAYEFYAANPEEMTPFAIGVEASPKSSPKGKDFYEPTPNPFNQPILNPSLKGRTLDSTKQSPFPSGRAGVGLPIYIETRNFHDYSRWKEVFQNAGFAYQPHYDIHVHCNAAHQISEQRIRQVKKALKNGVEIVLATSEQEIRDWYQILSRLYRTKVRTPLWSEAFFLHFYRSGVGKYLLVKYQDKVIGGMMCPILNNKAIYEWYVCGLDEEYRELYPSVMATYAAIEYAKTNALPLFDFMGAGKPNVPYGVRDFKMEFGGELVEHGRFLCVRKPLLYEIGKFGVRISKRKI